MTRENNLIWAAIRASEALERAERCGNPIELRMAREALIRALHRYDARLRCDIGAMEEGANTL